MLAEPQREYENIPLLEDEEEEQPILEEDGAEVEEENGEEEEVVEVEEEKKKPLSTFNMVAIVSAIQQLFFWRILFGRSIF